LQLVADAVDADIDHIRSLNPELKRDITPRDEVYNIRVPAGRSKQLAAILKRIPGDRRDTARVISVAPGEDLQAVATRTGFSAAQLQSMNGGVDLKSTNKLVVPNSNVRLTSWRRAKPGSEPEVASSLSKIRARKGDTIAKIAEARNLDVNEVARLNGIPAQTELKNGQEIKLPVTGGAAPSRRR
jgi:membrane-bound lytic murein transglycosylase D